MRPTKSEAYMDIARAVSSRSTCLRRRVGCVIVDLYDTVLATGYNGAVRSREDCLERGWCYRKSNNIPSGSDYLFCFACHGEINALIQAGRESRHASMYIYGEDVESGTVTQYPCANCSRAIINAEISNIFLSSPDGEIIEISPDEAYARAHKHIWSWKDGNMY